MIGKLAILAALGLLAVSQGQSRGPSNGDRIAIKNPARNQSGKPFPSFGGLTPGMLKTALVAYSEGDRQDELETMVRARKLVVVDPGTLGELIRIGTVNTRGRKLQVGQVKLRDGPRKGEVFWFDYRHLKADN